MQEVLQYLRANGYKTYIVTGGGQDFVRVYAEKTYGIPPEQVVGTVGGTTYSYDTSGRPILTKEPKLLLNDDNAGKPEGIHLMIGRRPTAAFGNSTGDREMLEYTWAGDGARLAMLLLHDDAQREYAYGPAQGLPDSKVGTFTPTLYNEAKTNGWTVISMKNDWRRESSRSNRCPPQSAIPISVDLCCGRAALPQRAIPAAPIPRQVAPKELLSMIKGRHPSGCGSGPNGGNFA